VYDHTVAGHAPKLLILATAGPERVRRVAAAWSAARPDGQVVVGVAEADRWRYADSGAEVLTLGENSLALDMPWARALVAGRAFDLIIVPIGVPRPGFARLPGFVLAIRPTSVRVETWLGLRLASRGVAWLFLAGLVPVLDWPLRALVGAARALDGLALLALQAVAGRRRRGVTGDGPICHVISSLGTGGAQRQVLACARHEAARGREVRLLVLTAHGDPEDEPCLVVETVYDRLRSTRLRHLLAYAFPESALVLALTAALRGLQPRCIWSWLFLANVVAAPAARLAGVPWIVTSVRNLSAWKSWSDYGHWWYRRADRRAAALSDLVVVNARALVADYATWAQVSPGKLRVVPNGIDGERLLAAPWRDLRPELGIAPTLPVVLTMGRLAPEKNQGLLLRCSARLLAEGLEHRLVIVGHGEGEASLRWEAAALGLGAAVIFAGKTSEPQSWYRSADIFVLSSDLEGMPNALMEAQLFGLAAVTTAAGGAGEVVVDGETGIVVPVGDEEAFARSLGRLLTDEPLRHHLGVRARHRMLTELSLERTVAAMGALIETSKEGRPG